MPRKTSKQLEHEINESLEAVKTKRTQRDLIERPTPSRVFGRIDHALSTAQDQIARNLANAETKISSPQLYKIGDELFDDIEKLRWKMRKWGR
jgi:hypothetical protein